MIKWYWRDGTPANTVSMDEDKEKWLEEVTAIEKKLTDPAYKIVKQTTLSNKKWVSTVWLGLDQRIYGVEGKPLIFETMVFKKKGNWDELDMRRYSTEEEAKKGHEELCKEWEVK